MHLPSIRRPRLPLLLYSYIASEMLAPFFASFVILYSVFFLVRLIPLLEIVLSLRIGLADFIRLFSYIFPHMLLYVIPMASMAGVIIGFTRLTNDREILALKACGTSLRHILPPLILVAASIAILTGFFSIRLIPAGEQGMKQLMFQLAKEKIDKGLKEKAFTEALGDLVVYVDEIDDQEKWHGVYVSDMRNREQPIITMAKSGYMEAEIDKMMVTIVLNDGTLHNTDGFDNQTIRFNRYQLQIPLRPPTRIDGDDVTQISKGSMTQRQLLEVAKEYGPKTRRGVVYLTEYHHRLVLPVGCFILSLLGLPLGMQAGPGRKAVGVPLGLGLFVAYYVAFTTCRVLCEDGILPLVFGMWLPNIIFFLLAIYMFWRVNREKPLIPERIQAVLSMVYDRFLQPVFFFLYQFCKRLISRRKSLFRSSKPTDEHLDLQIKGNAVSHVFHLPECEHYNCKNCTIEFKDVAIARESGFEPCGYCKTLLED